MKLKANWLQHFQRESELLWVSGLVFLLIFLGNRGLPWHGELQEWVQYILLGTVFPTLLLAVVLLERVWNRGVVILERLKLVLSLFCVWTVISFLVRDFTYSELVLAFIQVVLVAILARRTQTAQSSEPWAIRLPWILVSFLVVAGVWKAGGRLLWWTPFAAWIAGAPYQLIVLGLSFALVLWCLCASRGPGDGSRDRLLTPLNLIAVLVIGLASLCGNQLDPVEFHHCGVYVGPAQMVREGGWLLWDVPSQYGFLSILSLAWLPFRSVWQSLYALYSALLFLHGVFLYGILKSSRSGWLNFVFSLSLTLSAVFFIPGFFIVFSGPHPFPSVTTYRFWWCYVLLAILLWASSGKPSERNVVWAGSAAWLLGVLWSAESAMYCTVIWLPAYAILILARAGQSASWKHAWKETALRVLMRLAMPVALLFCTGGAISLFYVVRLGHFPDWLAFVEYCLSYSVDEFMTMPVDPRGAVWVLVFVLCLTATAALYLLRRGAGPRTLSLLWGMGGALWATSSYFVARSHENNVTNLVPICCIVAALILYLLRRSQTHEEWSTIVRLSLVPLFTVLLAVSFGNKAGVARLLLSPPAVTYALPQLSGSQLDILQKGGAQPGDPGVLIDDGMTLPQAWPTTAGVQSTLTAQPWLPGSPVILLIPLSNARRQLYMARFAERLPLGGWLLTSRDPRYPPSVPDASAAWFYDQLLTTHRPTRSYLNSAWQLTWFEPRRSTVAGQPEPVALLGTEAGGTSTLPASSGREQHPLLSACLKAQRRLGRRVRLLSDATAFVRTYPELQGCVDPRRSEVFFGFTGRHGSSALAGDQGFDMILWGPGATSLADKVDLELFSRFGWRAAAELGGVPYTLVTIDDPLRAYVVDPEPHAEPVEIVTSQGTSIRLDGYQWSGRRRELPPGRGLTVTLYWRVTGPPSQTSGLAVFVHLRGQQQETLAQADVPDLSAAELQPDGHLLTRHELAIPDDVPEGEYPIRVGIYQPDTMQRLAVPGDTSGENALALRGVLIKPFIAERPGP